MMFGLAAIPLFGLVALAVNFGFATQAKSQVTLAADTASMQATVTAANAYRGGATLANAILAGQNAGQAWFSVQAGTVLDSTVSSLPTVAVTYNSGTFTATVTYNVVMKTFFAPMFGTGGVAESGMSQAVITLATFVDITFLLDNSSSMTIASTAAGITALEGATPVYKGQYPPALVGTPPGPPSGAFPPLQPCAFACHWTSKPGTAADGLAQFTDDFYGVARQANIQLRSDVLQSATATAIGTMQSLELIANQNQFGIGIYTFGSALSQIYPPAGSGLTSSLDLADALPAVQAMTTPVTNDAANTNFGGPGGAMAQLTALLPAGGDGSTAAASKQALIIVTDGMEDWNDRSVPGNKGPFNNADCAAAKAKGITVYVLYTTYSDDPSVLLYDNIALKPYLDSTSLATDGMVPQLTACASAPTDFIQATDANGIASAFNILLQTALSAPGRYAL